MGWFSHNCSLHGAIFKVSQFTNNYFHLFKDPKCVQSGFYLSKTYPFRNANVSMDPFWASVILQAIRFALVFMSLPVNGKFKKKVVYLTCCGISCLGTLTLATYSYFNMDNDLTSNYSWTGYIPLIGIILMYVGYAFGLGTIPFILQVNFE